MIVDSLSHASKYFKLHKGLKAGFEFLQSNDLSALEVGKYPLPDDLGFVLIQSYDSKEIDEAKMESHQLFIDIQYLISGKEQMGYIPTKKATVKTPYNPDKDVMFYEEHGDLITFTEGMFAVFFPQDGHKPGIKHVVTTNVKKAVVKVKL